MITKTKISTVQRKIQQALAQISKDENVDISFGSITYNSAFYKTAMTIKTLDKTEKVENVYVGICKRLGFTQNVVGMTFVGTKGHICTIKDIKTRNRTYPIIADCTDGKSYKYSVEQIKQRIGGDKVINRNKNLEKLLS